MPNTLLLKISELEKELAVLKSEKINAVKIQESLLESEERYRALVELSPEAILVHKDLNIVFCNDAAAKLVGETNKENMIGGYLLNYIPEIHKASILARIEKEIPTTVDDPVIMRSTNKAGELYFLESIASYVPFDGGRAIQVIIRNVTKAKLAELELIKLNRSLKTLTEVSRRLFRFSDEETLLKDVAEIICNEEGHLFCWIGYKVEDESHSVKPVVKAGYDAGYLDNVRVSWGNNLLGQGPIGKSFKTGEKCVIQNFDEEITNPFWRKELNIRGFKSLLALPLKENEEVFGVLAIYSGSSFAFDVAETELLEQLSKDLSFAIHSNRIKEKQKRAAEALIESERKFRDMFEKDMTGNFILSPAGFIVSCNSAFKEIFGFSFVDDLAGIDFKKFFELPEDYATIYKKIKSGASVQKEELLLSSPKRKNVYAVFSIFGTINNCSELEEIKGYLFDGTERRKVLNELKASESKMKNLAYNLQNAREKERENVAREIHDELGQYLTGLKMDLSYITELLEQNPDIQHPKILTEKITSANELLDTTIKSVRRISTELRPAVLDNLGLLATIEWLTEDFEHRTGIKCESFITVEEVDFSDQISTAIFRIIQESLTNIKKHSSATRVSIELRRDENEYVIEVRDNGIGFCEEDLKKPDSFGILGIKERADMLGGFAEISSLKGKGTTLIVHILNNDN